MYQIISETMVMRLDDHAVIPVDPTNSDYQAYLRWVDAGGVALPAVVPPPKTAAQLAQEQIDAIELATMVPRVMREFFLESCERAAAEDAAKASAAGTPTTAEDLLAQNIGYVRAKTVNDQIVQLRAVISSSTT